MVAYKKNIYLIKCENQALSIEKINTAFVADTDYFVGVYATSDNQIRALTHSGVLTLFDKGHRPLSTTDTKVKNCIQLISTQNMMGILSKEQLAVLFYSTQDKNELITLLGRIRQKNAEYVAVGIISTGFITFDNQSNQYWIPLLADAKNNSILMGLASPHLLKKSSLDQRNLNAIAGIISDTQSQKDTVDLCYIGNNELRFVNCDANDKVIQNGYKTFDNINALYPYTVNNESRFLLAANKNNIYDINVKNQFLNDSDKIFNFNEDFTINSIIKTRNDNIIISCSTNSGHLLLLAQFNPTAHQLEIQSDTSIDFRAHLITHDNKIYAINRNLVDNNKIQYQIFEVNGRIKSIKEHKITESSFLNAAAENALNIIGSFDARIFFSYKMQDNQLKLFSLDAGNGQLLDQSQRFSQYFQEINCMIVKDGLIGFAGKKYNQNGQSEFTYFIAKKHDFSTVAQGTFLNIVADKITAFSFNVTEDKINHIFAINELGHIFIYNDKSLTPLNQATDANNSSAAVIAHSNLVSCCKQLNAALWMDNRDFSEKEQAVMEETRRLINQSLGKELNSHLDPLALLNPRPQRQTSSFFSAPSDMNRRDNNPQEQNISRYVLFGRNNSDTPPLWVRQRLNEMQLVQLDSQDPEITTVLHTPGPSWC